MIKCGIDYKPIEDKCKAEEQKEQERINNNKKLFNEFAIKSVKEVTAYDKYNNALFVITTPDED
jgi:hypothetical protein